MSTLIVQIDEKQIRAIVKEAVTEALHATQAQYFTKKEAADFLKISPVTLWSYERRGLLTPVRVGGRDKYTRGELDRFSQGKQ